MGRVWYTSYIFVICKGVTLKDLAECLNVTGTWPKSSSTLHSHSIGHEWMGQAVLKRGFVFRVMISCSSVCNPLFWSTGFENDAWAEL